LLKNKDIASLVRDHQVGIKALAWKFGAEHFAFILPLFDSESHSATTPAIVGTPRCQI